MRKNRNQHLHPDVQPTPYSQGVKIGYCLDRVEQYILALLGCFKCQKYGHHRETCRGRQPTAVKKTRTT